MFRKNQQHQQSSLFETVEQLPEKHRLRLENSWGGAFYRELFCRIDETLFAKLYSEKPEPCLKHRPHSCEEDPDA